MTRLMQQVRDQVFDKKVESVSKACRKPARTCRKSGCKPGRKPGLLPGLQLARIMECGLNCVDWKLRAALYLNFYRKKYTQQDHTEKNRETLRAILECSRINRQCCPFITLQIVFIHVRLNYFLPPTKEEVNVFNRVCLSVCLSVSKITQKRVHGFG